MLRGSSPAPCSRPIPSLSCRTLTTPAAVGCHKGPPCHPPPAPSNGSQCLLTGHPPLATGPSDPPPGQGGTGCPWGLSPGHPAAPGGPPGSLCPHVPLGHPWCPPACPKALCSDTSVCPQGVLSAHCRARPLPRNSIKCGRVAQEIIGFGTSALVFPHEKSSCRKED